MNFLKKSLSLCILFTLSLSISGCSEQTVPGTVHSLNDLPGKNIAVLENSLADLYATDLELPSGEEEVSVIQRYYSLDDAVADLEEGFIDCIILNDFQAEQYCESHNNLSVLEEVFLWNEYAICLNQENTELADRLNQELALLEENGTLQELADKYLISDISENIESDASALTSDNNEQTLRVATCSGFEPYIFYDENDQLTGFDVELTASLAQKMNMNAEMIDMDYEEIFSSLANGSVDMAIGGISPQDGDSYLYTDSYTTLCLMVLVRK